MATSPLLVMFSVATTLVAEGVAAAAVAAGDGGGGSSRSGDAASPRTRTPLAVGWKFHLGNPASESSSCNSSTFPINLTRVQCLDLDEQHGPRSAEECRDAACSSRAAIWQWGGGCWTGQPPFNCTHGPSPGGIVGGGRLDVPLPGANNCTAGLPCDPAYDDSDWEKRTVPHDFVIEGTVDPELDPNHGALATNVSWYRREITLPASTRHQLVWLTFDGVYRNADVYINGALVKHHTEGYTSWSAYLHNASSPLRFGPDQKNTLAVFVDATQSELWCYEGGGIFRHVWLETAEALSVVPWGFSFATYVTGAITGDDATKPQTTDGALAMPQVDIQNAGSKNRSVVVQFTLSERGGKQVLHASFPVTVPAGGWQRVAPGSGPWNGPALKLGSIAQPIKLWNTADAPPLYTATVTLREPPTRTNSESGGQIVDTVETTVGVRNAIFDAQRGFVLNGAKVLVKGTSNHLGFGGVGLAVPDRVMEFQVATLKTLGCNAWRTAHNPVSPELLQYADEYGMLVWEENRFVTHGVQPLGEPESDGPTDLREPQLPREGPWRRGGEGASAGEDAGAPPYVNPTGQTADPVLLQNAQDMALRDRNHPSIVLWSLCNELGCLTNDPNGGDIAVQFKHAIQSVDASRPITGNTVQSHFFDGKGCDCANPNQSAECAGCFTLTDKFAAAMDVQSFSYEYDAYAKFHQAMPWKPVGGGESCSCTTDRGVFGTPAPHSGHTSPTRDRDVAHPVKDCVEPGCNLFDCIEASWASVATTKYVYGNFVWTGFDYRGETGPTGWPAVSSHYGVFDNGGFPKVGTHYYNAWWRDFDVGDESSYGVSISPDDWTAPVPVGTPVEVRVTSAAHSAALFLNGVALSPPPPPPHPPHLHQQEQQQQDLSFADLVTGPTEIPRFGSLKWLVPFAPGNLTAVAYSAAGAVLSTHSVLSAKKAARLRVSVAAPHLFVPPPPADKLYCEDCARRNM